MFFLSGWCHNENIWHWHFSTGWLQPFTQDQRLRGGQVARQGERTHAPTQGGASEQLEKLGDSVPHTSMTSAGSSHLNNAEHSTETIWGIRTNGYICVLFKALGILVFDRRAVEYYNYVNWDWQMMAAVWWSDLVLIGGQGWSLASSGTMIALRCRGKALGPYHQAFRSPLRSGENLNSHGTRRDPSWNLFCWQWPMPRQLNAQHAFAVYDHLIICFHPLLYMWTLAVWCNRKWA